MFKFFFHFLLSIQLRVIHLRLMLFSAQKLIFLGKFIEKNFYQMISNEKVSKHLKKYFNFASRNFGDEGDDCKRQWNQTDQKADPQVIQ